MRHLWSYAVWTVIVITGVIVTTNLGVYISTKPYLYDPNQAIPAAEAVLIPGAAIYGNGTLTPIFQDRVDIAVRLYDSKRVKKILVSGDNSTVSHNEVNAVLLYLRTKGIPDQDIFQDHAGFDTYSSMYRARAIFGVSSLLIATQSFHLPRSVFIARALGIEAYGVNADVGTVSFSNNIREMLADEKALLDILTHRTPKFLGDTIPIMGDGTLYP
jgi:SanA protein